MIGAIEIVQDKASKKPFDAAAAMPTLVQDAALDEGLIVRAIRDTIALCPPLIVDDAQVDELFDKLGRTLDRVHGGVR